MDINILAEFVILMETCSFQETAAFMNVSQSSLTKHIHKLEDELNLSLFDRSSRNIAPTEFGRAYYPYAKQIVQLQQDSLATLSDLLRKDTNSFTIVYSPIIGQYGMVNTIAQFTQKFPDHNLVSIESYSPLSILKQKKCDFAFVSENDMEETNFNKLIYKTDHLAVVFSSSHPLANSEFVTLEQLQNENFILHMSQNNVPEETEKFLSLCESRNFTPNVVVQSQYTSTMVRFVSAKRGVAVLNRMHIPHDIPDVSIVELYPTVPTYIYMLYPRRFMHTSAVDFLHFMIESINAESQAPAPSIK